MHYHNFYIIKYHPLALSIIALPKFSYGCWGLYTGKFYSPLGFDFRYFLSLLAGFCRVIVASKTWEHPWILFCEIANRSLLSSTVVIQLKENIANHEWTKTRNEANRLINFACVKTEPLIAQFVQRSWKINSSKITPRSESTSCHSYVAVYPLRKGLGLRFCFPSQMLTNFGRSIQTSFLASKKVYNRSISVLPVLAKSLREVDLQPTIWLSGQT